MNQCYYLESNLSFFRFNSTIQKGPFGIRWFKHMETEDHESCGKLLEHQVMISVVDYFQKLENFNGSKNYWVGNESTLLPEEDIYDLLPTNANNPDHLVLRKMKSKINPVPGRIYSTMEIELLQPSQLPILERPPFDIIGVIMPNMF